MSTDLKAALFVIGFLIVVNIPAMILGAINALKLKRYEEEVRERHRQWVAEQAELAERLERERRKGGP